MKPTQAQLWLVHSLEFYVFGAVFGSVATIYGAFQTGKLDFASAGVILGTALSGLIANVYKGVLQNANAMQAVSDSFNELKASHNAAAQQTGNALSHLTGLVTGLLHLRNAQQSAPATAPVASPQSAQPAPVPARPQFTMPPFTAPQAAMSNQQGTQAQP